MREPSNPEACLHLDKFWYILLISLWEVFVKMGYKVSNLLQFDLPKKVLQIQVQTRQESLL